jgi:hypothetical protein
MHLPNKCSDSSLKVSVFLVHTHMRRAWSFISFCHYCKEKFLITKVAETNKQKEERRKIPKPEKQEGMPQHHYCPPTKRREDRNPKYHEEQQKVVVWIPAAHLPKNVEKEYEYFDNQLLFFPPPPHAHVRLSLGREPASTELGSGSPLQATRG